MIENNEQRTENPESQQWLPQQTQAQTVPPVPYGGYAPAAYGAPGQGAPLGQVRSTGACIALMIVTLGIYSWVWYFKTHEEMKRHTNTGLGGGLALVLAIFVGFVMPFISSSEVGGLYERRGLRAPVSGATGLWALLLGWFFGAGLIIWFVKTNGALNAYWRSQGVR